MAKTGQRATTRDLLCEDFETVSVGRVGRDVLLRFDDEEAAQRAEFVIKNALELGLPVQIRHTGERTESRKEGEKP